MQVRVRVHEHFTMIGFPPSNYLLSHQKQRQEYSIK